MNQTAQDVLIPLRSGCAAGKLLRWDLTWLSFRPCPSCGSSREADEIAIRPDGLSLNLCECGMLFIQKAPNDKALSDFYQQYAGVKYPKRLSRLKLWKQSLVNPYVRILRESGGLKGQRVLDVGCSYGEFLQQLSGAIRFGHDLDASVRPILEQSGIQYLESLRDGFQNSFEIVTAFQLLEHLRDVDSLLESLRKIIKDKGRLLIATPNGGEADRIGTGWLGFRVDLEHLNYFSIKTLANALERHGFYVDCYWEHLQPVIFETPLPLIDRLARMLSLSMMDFGRYNLTVLARPI